MLKRNRKKKEERQRQRITPWGLRFLGMLFDALMSYITVSYYPYTPVF